MNDRYLVLTPEKVVLSYRLAGIGTRVSAQLLDLLFIGLLMGLVAFLTTLSGFVLGSAAAEGLFVLATFVLFFGYPLFCEMKRRGQTFGKQAMGLRVVMVDGTPVTPTAAIARNMLRVADFLPGLYLVGFLAVFTNPLAQRIGDLVAGTVVVHERPHNAAFTPAPHRVGLHPFEGHIGDLRAMTLEEYVAIKRLCDRFPHLPPETQVEGMRQIWEPFAARMEVPAIAGVHPVYLMEAVVMKYGRLHRLV